MNDSILRSVFGGARAFALTAGAAALCAAAIVPAQVMPPIEPRFRVEPPISVAIPEDPTLLNGRPNLQSFTLADVNGDGLADVVAIDPDQHRVAVYLSLGNGMFSAPETPQLGDGFVPTVVAVADVASPIADGGNSRPDGRPDLIVGSDDGAIAVLVRTADGHFVLQQTVEPDSTVGIIGLVPGDFDAQAGKDVAVLDGSGVVLLCDNNGSLVTCGAADPIAINGGSDTIVKMVAGNFNGDANLDLALLDQTTNQVFVLYGNGDGTFAVPGSGIDVQGEGNQSRDLAVGRLDGDGSDDLVVINSGDFAQEFGVTLLSRPNGRFERGLFVADFAANALTLGDFDGTASGTLDAAVGYEDTLASVNIGDGQGGFADPFSPSGIAGLGNVSVIQSANLTADTYPDLVALNLDGSQLRVARNISGDPTPTPILPTSTPTATPTRRPADNDDCSIGERPGRPAVDLLAGAGILWLLARRRRFGPLQ